MYSLMVGAWGRMRCCSDITSRSSLEDVSTDMARFGHFGLSLYLQVDTDSSACLIELGLIRL